MEVSLHKDVFICILTSSLSEIYSFLKRNKIEDLMDLRQPDGSTILHHLAEKNKTSTTEFVIRYCKDSNSSSFHERVQVWVNSSTYKEKVTCIHFAITRGNLDLVQLFIKHGGNIELKNSLGMGPMHLASENDQILIMAFLYNLGIQFEDNDENGDTPLHLAVVAGCELATAVLLSWKVPVNQVNRRKESPLHFAVCSKSQRIVRSLLLRGADVGLRDQTGKTPMDIAKEKKDLEIVALLENPGLLSVCGIKPPQRPNRFRRMLMMVYLALVTSGLVSVYFVLGIEDIVLDTLSVLEVFFIIATSLKNPGYIKKNHPNKLQDLAQDYEAYQICPECVCRRPPRSRHCQNCNKCVEKFDHHCPWINNCIGGRNLGIFYCFLIITFSFISYVGYISLITLLAELKLNPMNYLKISASLMSFLVPLSFLGPLFLLIWVQTLNFLSNTTTNERYSRRIEPTGIERTDSDSQVDRNSVFRNVWQMCCNSVKQEYKNRHRAHETVTRYSAITREFELSQSLLDNSDE